MIRKAFIALLLVLLVGCTNDINSIVEEQNFSRYQAHYISIFDNDRFIRESSQYELSVVFTQVENKYRYDIIIDNPIIAMYDIEVMVVENDISFERANKMMPNFGIFETGEINMIPYQVDVEKNYVKGIVVSGLVDVPVVELKIMVSWKDYSKLNSFREFFIRNLDYERMNDDDFDIIGGEDENTIEPDDEDEESEQDQDDE